MCLYSKPAGIAQALSRLPEKHEPAAPFSPCPSQGSFPVSEALGQGRGWRAEAGPAPLSNCLPGCSTHLSTEGTFCTCCRTTPGSVKLTKGPSCQGLSICSQGQHTSYQQASGWTPASDEPWKMQAVESKKMGKESKAAAFLWSKPVNVLA